MKEKYNLREELLAADEKYRGDPSIEGKGMLTFPQYVNSMRSVMFASHLNQFKTQLYSDFPQFFSGGENVVGKHNTSYKVLDESIIFRKIVKFEGLVENPTVYKLFLFNKKKNRYEVLERKPLENLSEVYGYRNNNEMIDSFVEGQEIDQGTVAYKSVSYDQSMNYSYGRDVVTMYSLDPYTSEDAAVISDDLMDKLVCTESEENIATFNDNDYPLNLYGDEVNYKTFPDIGEESNGILVASRRKINNQVLHDFKADMLSKVLDTDTKYYLKGKVMDIDIYCNNEDLQDNSFYHQIYTYWVAQNEYYTKIVETCEEIFASGEDYSADIDYLYKRANEMLDLKKKWKEKDSAFSNVQVHILVEREVGPSVGQKITGRSGNKSVISQIRKKEDMPYYYDADGNKVHVQLILNLLAIVNRTTAAPIFELATNFIGKRISEYMRTKLTTLKEREKIYFDVLTMFNSEEAKYLKTKYKNLTTKQKQEWMDYCMNHKIHFHQPSMTEESPIFYRLDAIREKYKDILAPDTMYIQKFGREIQCIEPSYIANMYILMLKQTAKKGFSVRGIGAVNAKGIPERSYKSKSHKDLFSSTAIRFGEFETLKIGGIA